MGIPTCRFVDEMHEQFVCTVCFEVAVDPVVVNGCEHIFCHQCIKADGLIKCPTCQERFKEPRWERIKGGLRRCYFALEIKCLNTSCRQVLDVRTFADHDENCNVTFQLCPDCGYKSRRSQNNVHSCIKVLKEFYETKLDQVKNELEQVKGRMNMMRDEISGQLRFEISQLVQKKS